MGSWVSKEALGGSHHVVFSVGGGGRIMGQDSLGLEMAWDAHGGREIVIDGHGTVVLFAGFRQSGFFIGGFGVLRCLS